MATEVASGYAGIYPKLVGTANFVSQVQGAFGSVGNVGKAALSGVTTSLSAVAAGVTGIAATGGISRALNIEQAQTTFKGLGLEWGDFYNTMNDAVTGTSFGFDVAAKAASQLAASGVSAGGDMEKALNGCVGAAATYGQDLGDLSGIWSKVAAKGKLSGEQLMQFTDRGINATSVLASYLGKSQAEVSQMVTAGQIDFDTFSSAMNAAFGDSAKAANNTFTGSLANMKSSLARIGQDFFKPILDGAIPVFNSLRGVFDAVKVALQPLVQKLQEFVGVSYNSNGELTRTGGAAEKLAGWIDQLAQKIQGVDLSTLTGGAKLLAGALGGVAALSFGGFIGQIPIIGQAFSGLTGGIVPALTSAIGGIPSALGGVVNKFAEVGKVASSAGGGLSALGGAFTSVFSPASLIAAALAAVAAAFVYVYATNEDFRNTVNGLVGELGGGLMGILSQLQPLGEPIAGLLSQIAGVIAQLIPFIMQVVVALMPIVSTLVSILVPILQTIISIVSAILPIVSNMLQTIMGVILAVLPTIVAAVQPVLEFIANLIQTVLPIIQAVIVGALTVIGAIFSTIWGGIQIVVETAMGIIQSVIQIVTSAISGDWDGVWNGIKNLVSVVWNGIKSAVENAINGVKGIIEAVLNAIKGIWDAAWGAISGALGGIWGGITGAVSAGIDGIVGFFSNLPGNILGALGNLGGLLIDAGHQIISGLLSGIKSAVQGVFDFVSGIGSTIASLKGPKEYDLKLLIPNGQWIMQSLSSGLEKGMDGVRDTLGGITANISDFGFSGAMDAAVLAVSDGMDEVQRMIDGGAQAARSVAVRAATGYGLSDAVAASAYGTTLIVDGAVVNSRPEMEKATYTVLSELKRLGYMQGGA